MSSTIITLFDSVLVCDFFDDKRSPCNQGQVSRVGQNGGIPLIVYMSGVSLYMVHEVNQLYAKVIRQSMPTNQIESSNE